MHTPKSEPVGKPPHSHDQKAKAEADSKTDEKSPDDLRRINHRNNPAVKPAKTERQHPLINSIWPI
jgi:hypothetical protein